MRAILLVLASFPIFAMGDTGISDPEIKTLMVRFHLAAKRYAPTFTKKDLVPLDLLKKISITLGQVEGQELGLCISGGWENPKIVLNEKKWKTLTTRQREMLFYHELGHCVLNREHDSQMMTRNESKIPRSLMYPTNFDEEVYLLNRDHYLSELFSELFAVPKLNVAVPQYEIIEVPMGYIETDDEGEWVHE